MKKSERYHIIKRSEDNKYAVYFYYSDKEEDDRNKYLGIFDECKDPKCSGNGVYHCLKAKDENGWCYIIGDEKHNYYCDNVRGISFFSDVPKVSKKKNPPWLAKYLATKDGASEIKTVAFKQERK